MPNTPNSYLMGIKRPFTHCRNYKIQLLTGTIFSWPREGSLAVIDNKIRSLQAAGMHMFREKLLSKDDLIKLFESKSISKTAQAGF